MPFAPTTMTYGEYSFRPVPVVTIKRSAIQSKNRELPIGFTFQITLNGTLTPIPNGQGGLSNVDVLIDELRVAFNRSGMLFEIKCGDSVVIQTYPRLVGDIEFGQSDNNWVFTVPYTITLEYDADDILDEDGSFTIPPYIEDYQESWDMEWVQDHRWFTWDLSAVTDQDGDFDYPEKDGNNPFELRVSHNVTVRGKQTWSNSETGITGEMTRAVDNAMQWLLDVFDDPMGGSPGGFGHNGLPTGLYYGIGNFYSMSGWNNLPIESGYYESGDSSYFLPLDHYRTHAINETEGTVTLNENWIVIGANTGITGPENRLATEDFDVTLKASLNGITTVSINGTIRGYEDRNYGEPYDDLENPLIRGNTVNGGLYQQAYQNASGYFEEVQYRLFPRAQLIFQNYSDYGRLNRTPVDKSVGHNPSRGTVTYDISYDSRPCNMITGALSESITINDTNPHDIYASLVIPGRLSGPILQSIGTVSESRRDIAISCSVLPPTSCASFAELNINKPETNVKNLLCELETELTDAYNIVFKTADTVSWDPKVGNYSRNVSYTYMNCSGDAVETSLCN